MDLEQIKNAEARHYMPVFVRDGLAIARGSGNKLYDTDGNEYTDFVAGIATNILGYDHPEYTRAVCEQVHTLMHVSNHYYTPIQSEYIELLCSATGMPRVFLCNSGAEANECAIKLARKIFKKRGEHKRILSAEGAFHGRTLATLTATDNTSQHAAYAPLPDGFGTFKYNDIADFKAKLTDDVGAVMLETIQGERGVRPFDDAFITEAYKLCKAKNVLFILDEVQTGMGRTGTLLSYERFNITPDIVTMAKGIAGGIPMGACLATEQAGTAFDVGDHGSTFGGNALACAAAKVTLEILLGGLLHRSAAVGEYFGKQLAKLDKYGFIADIRGRGLMRGIELRKDVPAATFEQKLRERGYLVNVAGNNTVRLIPPLTVTESEIDGLIAAFDAVCAETDA